MLNLADTAGQFISRVPRLAFQLDEVVRSLSDANAPASQISLANRQVLYLQSARQYASTVAELGAVKMGRVLRGRPTAPR